MNTVRVNTSTGLTDALGRALPGDEIVLQAGAEFIGEFRLPPHGDDATPVTLRSSEPLPDRRLTEGDAALLPRIGSRATASAIVGEQTKGWRLDGLLLESTPSGEGEIITLQGAANVALDRILIVAGANGQKRAIRGNGTVISLRRSHIANIFHPWQDSQAFCAWDGAGPYTVQDNFAEAAGENFMFGGANSASLANVPADILVEGNHCTKRLEWRGRPINIKNLFELKSAKRVIVRGNLFERTWAQGQDGTAILFTGRNDEGGAPWSAVEDVLFERNIVRDAANGMNCLGQDDQKPSGRTTRIVVRDNLFLIEEKFLTVGAEVGVLTVARNTVRARNSFLLMYPGSVRMPDGTSRAARWAVEELTVESNVGRYGEYGVLGADGPPASNGFGLVPLTAMTRVFIWNRNILATDTVRETHSASLAVYPPSTWMPTETALQAQLDANERLKAGNPWGDGLGWTGELPAAAPPAEEPLPPPIPEPPAPALDMTPPNASMVVARVVGSSNVRVTVTADDDVRVERVDYYMDGRLRNVLSAPTNGTLTYQTQLKVPGKGRHEVLVRVYDAAANARELRQELLTR